MMLEVDESRIRMVKDQIESRHITSQSVLSVFRTVPRHEFVPAVQQVVAYQDRPLPIGEGQTISQPYIVALMTDLLDLHGDETVLEIGTGSGYQAAILSRLCKWVHSVEIYNSLADKAAETFQRLDYTNITVHKSDGSLGWQPASPYDGILVTAAAPRADEILLRQLKENGRMVIPVGSHSGQILQVWTRQQGIFTKEDIITVAFVPLVGDRGWKEEEWKRDTWF
ncbi:MAG TPA: protein-L-isoaspartate(D-aspartate) O-methyltransferase [Longilinea sp.]|nr:protein-L-isoaspartate(D-aspartate) O-methyltransferase [Longilinea sp.]